MIIGTDFPKIPFDFLGLHLLELNGFIGNMIVCLLSYYYYKKTTNIFTETNDLFIENWRFFFLVFALCFLFGGFGHLLFYYTDILGKMPAWYLSIIAVYFIERATFAIRYSMQQRAFYYKVALIKMIVFIILETLVVIFVNFSHKPEIGLIIPTVNLLIGLPVCLGVIGRIYQKKVHEAFKYQWISVILLVASMLVQVFKFNIHPQFDRNDLSHMFIAIVLMLFYRTIRCRNFYKI